tara:strand:- start:159662 stop:160732 length:1071 start_codon:yes stop_codon:yes gene_type:complete
MEQKIKYLIEAARHAPSGENAQPWRFVWSKSKQTLEVHIEKSRSSSLYDWGYRASYVAVGAAIQNILLASGEVDLQASHKFFPLGEGSNVVAEISFTKFSGENNALASCIKKRVTNRKKYDSNKVPEEILNLLKNLGQESFGGKIKLTEDRGEIKTLAKVGSTNEEIMLGNKTIHDFFFSHVNWTKEEDRKNKVGFYIKTLELPAPAEVGFKLVSNWSRANPLNKLFKFPKVVAAQNAAVYESGSAIGLVESPTDSITDAVKTGMLIQKLWLTVTKCGLQLQPVTGILYFALGVKNSQEEGFSAEDLKKIDVQYKKVQDIFDVTGTPFFMFRIGYADAPTAQALRFNTDELLTIHD